VTIVPTYHEDEGVRRPSHGHTGIQSYHWNWCK